jgi:hypothetical protein
MFDGLCSRCVICVAALSPSIQRTQICEPLGSPSRVKAMRVPSGDQSAPDPFVRKRFLDPSAFMIHRAELLRSLTLSTHPRV